MLCSYVQYTCKIVHLLYDSYVYIVSVYNWWAGNSNWIKYNLQATATHSICLCRIRDIYSDFNLLILINGCHLTPL